MKPHIRHPLAASTIVFLATLLTVVAHAEQPLVCFDFEEGLHNTGTLGGEGHFTTYAKNEDPGLDWGPLGRCLDLTAAARHGGITANDVPAGGAVLFQHAALDALQTFTLTLWSRQSPLARGDNARLLTKEGAWDLLPQAGGLTLGLGWASQKVVYQLPGKPREPAGDDWRFSAVAVGPENIRAYIGGLNKPLMLCGEQPRREHTATGPGQLVLGTLSGIRPFNGWLAHVRIYGAALSEKSIAAIFTADVANAQPSKPAPVYALARPPANTHRFQLQHADIPFSVRWQKRPEALGVMQAFHATQCLWVYGTDPKVVAAIQQAGIGYQGALNGLQGQELSRTNRCAQGDPTGRHEDLDGLKNTPPWMVTFGPHTFTGCCNHPAFRALFFKAAQQQVENGVDMLHVDDWAMNASWVDTGVCFCEYCRAGFRDYLQQHCTPGELQQRGIPDIRTFDYREHLRHNGVPDATTYRAKFRNLPLTPLFVAFQVESMRAFFREFRHRLDVWSPHKYIPVSVNALLTQIMPTYNLCGVDVVDFFMGESALDAGHQTAAEYVLAAKAAEAFGLTQVVSPIPRSTARTRAALATTYALGQWHLVPWDIYMGSDATGIQPRYFGTREQYGAYYDFIHEHPALFEHHESAAEIGVLFNADAPDHGALADYCLKLARQQLPFHLIAGASQSARVPVRAADLRAIRVLVEFSPVDSFCADDQQTLRTVREAGLLRIIPPSADLAAVCRLRGMDLLRMEAPEGIYAFPRVERDRKSSVIHLVNWNLAADGSRAEIYHAITLTLQQPGRWGTCASATYYQPGEKPVTLTPEYHADGVRLTLPQIETWGIVELP